MSKSKIVGIMSLVVFAMGIVLAGDVVAGEKGKVVAREVFYRTNILRLNIPDVEGHTMHLVEAKLIHFNEKFGPAVGILTNFADVTKGTGPHQGYVHLTFSDGSTITHKWKGESKGGGTTISGVASSVGTWSFIKGTGKFEGIQGEGTWKSYNLGPGQWYSDLEGEYKLP